MTLMTCKHENRRTWRDSPTSLPVFALLGLLASGCSTFSPATSFEPEYYVDEYGMVYLPEQDRRSGAARLRPGYSRFSVTSGNSVYDPFYDPVYAAWYGDRLDPYGRSLAYRHPFYSGANFGFAYYRPPVYRPPVLQPGDDTDAGADPGPTGAGVVRPIASPINIISVSPEPVYRDGMPATSRRASRTPRDGARPSYGNSPRETRPARPAQPARASQPRRPARPARPAAQPRVIDP